MRHPDPKQGALSLPYMDKVKTVAMVMASVLVLAVGIGGWRHAASAGQREAPRQEQPVPPNRDVAKVPVIPATNRKFHINLRISGGKGEKSEVADARLLAPEGQVASFAKGKQYDFPIGGGKTDAVVLGPVVRVVVHSDEGGKVRLDMTVNHPTIGTFGADDVVVEMESLRVIRKMELGESIVAKLNTGGKDSTPLYVLVSVREAKEDAREKTIAEAENNLKMAEYYHRTGHDDSACFYFQLIERRYPDSVYAERARERLAELKKRPAKHEGDPARVGQIFIIGNKKTQQDVILDQVQLYPGQVFYATDLRIAERNLARLKGFKSPPKVTVLDPDDDSPYKDIKITVEEK